ncbi:MAG: DNA mismatch repair protein MutS [Thermaerobacter sp.]|nr:DNA mismatch repair protein MutS [Thermaerobacter sp.]
MKVHLLYSDRDAALNAGLPDHAQALVDDLGLDAVFGAMADGDALFLDVVRKGVLSSIAGDVATILYRQDILKDCLANPRVVMEIFECAGEGLRDVKRLAPFTIFNRSPNSILYSALTIVGSLSVTLRRLRAIGEAQGEIFRSEGFRNLFSTLEKELDDEFFSDVQRHRNELAFRGGVLLSGALGVGNKGTGYVLRAHPPQRSGWMQRLMARKAGVYSFKVAERDESGHRALSLLKDRGVNLVANALAQSNDHILGFLNALQTELAFYIGCLRLRDRLAAKGLPTCLPAPSPRTERRRAFSGLYDVSLALQQEDKIVGSDADFGDRCVVVVTGANRGGKSTFLRSIGQAQLMMQAGMFIAAESFAANVSEGVFTHFRREEDQSMQSGKLDEELSRLHDITSRLNSNSMLLLNESLSSTNEREGSEIARQIVSALAEKRVMVFFVTHLYEFARDWHEASRPDSMFLRAERLPDGTRTFKIVPGGPLATSFGEDLYGRIING